MLISLRDDDLRLHALELLGELLPDSHHEETASSIKTTDELIDAYGKIARAQAARGFADQARKTFVIAESQARKHGFTGEDHAQLTAAMAEANLLPEVFAQVQAMARRDRSEYWFDQELDPVIHAHIKAGQLRRAFEIAELLSEHQSGNPHYFLVIASALAQ